MYSIKYYNNKREKPVLKKPNLSENNGLFAPAAMRLYLHNQDLINKCWDIQSLTIDFDDLNHIPYDDSLDTLIFSLYAKYRRTQFDDSINSITIVNDNHINMRLIYAILNCKWMLNIDDCLNNYDLLLDKAEDELDDLVSKHIHIQNDKDDGIGLKKSRLARVKRQIVLKKYYIKTLRKYKNNEQSFTPNSIKLGRYLYQRRLTHKKP